MTREAVNRWLSSYAAAWRERDPEAAARLFTEDSIYRSSPFREPHLGQGGVRAYWTRATKDQKNLDLRLGAPVIEGPLGN
ncbi:MAG TPA: nuclear transport factor 2 family protein [Candidatus Eisenbacteria bacterium]|jgi:ketosteroid isomerase-like protein|nr:nuclear transport factor 2 family protein [Candidatus Eisenbacteria bacterium]